MVGLVNLWGLLLLFLPCLLMSPSGQWCPLGKSSGKTCTGLCSHTDLWWNICECLGSSFPQPSLNGDVFQTLCHFGDIISCALDGEVAQIWGYFLCVNQRIIQGLYSLDPFTAPTDYPDCYREAGGAELFCFDVAFQGGYIVVDCSDSNLNVLIGGWFQWELVHCICTVAYYWSLKEIRFVAVSESRCKSVRLIYCLDLGKYYECRNNSGVTNRRRWIVVYNKMWRNTHSHFHHHCWCANLFCNWSTTTILLVVETINSCFCVWVMHAITCGQ